MVTGVGSEGKESTWRWMVIGSRATAGRSRVTEERGMVIFGGSRVMGAVGG